MNYQIIRFLALNGPSIIYSVAQYLSSVSETKVHYPTVNRRMHELLQSRYLNKAGTRVTKAGLPADLYTLGLKGEFAVLSCVPDGAVSRLAELSPKEIRLLISNASARNGSPFILFKEILDEHPEGLGLVEKEFIPTIISAVRGGSINIDAPDEEAISTNFASVVARHSIRMMDRKDGNKGAAGSPRNHIELLMHALERIANPSSSDTDAEKPQGGSRKSPVPLWANELKVLLRLYSVKYG